MSAFGGKADIDWTCFDVRFSPKADISRVREGNRTHRQQWRTPPCTASVAAKIAKVGRDVRASGQPGTSANCHKPTFEWIALGAHVIDAVSLYYERHTIRVP